jgi:hypothetical protein
VFYGTDRNHAWPFAEMVLHWLGHYSVCGYYNSNSSIFKLDFWETAGSALRTHGSACRERQFTK